MEMTPLQLKLGMMLILAALAEAWIVVARRYLGVEFLRRWIRSDQDLLRSHIDFILMALLLFAFAAWDTISPRYLVLLSCIGAVTNPLLFVMMSLKPDIRKSPLAPFGIFSAISFSFTTAGFGGRAFLVLIS